MFDKLQKEYLLPESKGDLRKYGVAVHPILLEHVSIKVEDPEAAMQLALKNSTHFGDVVCSAKGEGATLTILGEVSRNPILKHDDAKPNSVKT